MQTLKVKLWDKEQRHWAGHSDCTGQLICNRDQYPWVWSWESRYFIPVLFTGQKDKNGKEIYQGDIYKISDSLFEVIFNDIDAAFGLKSGEAKFLFQAVKTGEVIGNIYDNPELLK